MHQINGIFNKHCTATGNARTIVFQKSLAKAIAYALPCFYGQPEESGRFYNNGARETAHKLLNLANERQAFSIDCVLADVRTLWIARYNIANAPLAYNDELKTFEATCNVAGTGVALQVELLYKPFYQLFKMKLNGESKC